MFHELAVEGSSVAFWEQAWREGDYAESARYCDADPLRPLFDRNVARGSVLLEGGCGRGGYVAYQAARGVAALGLDFAVSTLADVRRRYPGLVLAAADVACLPLRDHTVDTYYSGGVVEHFESGPHRAISEARRVLRPGGTLLISVPYFSPLRRTLAPFRRTEWRRTSLHQPDMPPQERVFFQYAYRPKEFEEILAGHGFDVVSRQGYSILWGLYEVPVAGRALRRIGQRARPSASVGLDAAQVDTAEGDTAAVETAEGETDGSAVAGPRLTALLKRLVVSEDVSIPVLGSALRGLRWLAANMMMYECVSPVAG